MTRSERVRELLEAAFSPSVLEIVDESYLHAGHNADAANGGTHLFVRIEAEVLSVLGRVEKHRRVNAVLKDEFASGLHALRLMV